MAAHPERIAPGHERKIPALVLGSGITPLGVIRALGRAGIPAFLASRVSDGNHLSRWHRAAPGWDSGTPWPKLNAYLESGPLDRAVLIPCSDHEALEVAQLPSRLSERYPNYLPPVASLRTLTNKSQLYELLDAQKIPYPRTWLDPSEEELGSRSSGGGRIFLKPHDSQAFFQRFGVKGMWIHGLREAWPPMVREVLSEGGVVAQEYVPGPASNHYFIDGFALDGGQVAARLARRRLRMFPTDFGNSSYMVTVPLDEVSEAVAALNRLLSVLDYRGIFSAEFKRDERDGVFRLLEVNARAWWFVEFAARCGVDVTKMNYDAALGREVKGEHEYQVGRRLCHPYYDVQACWNGRGNPAARILRFLTSLLGADQPVFQVRDPAPAFKEGLGFICSFLRRRQRRLLRKPKREIPR